LLEGTWGAEIVDVLKSQEGDIIIDRKRGLCGFTSTNLDVILRNRNITNIAQGGFLTNCCVESMMRTGYEKGYNVVTLQECTTVTREKSSTWLSTRTIRCSYGRRTTTSSSLHEPARRKLPIPAVAIRRSTGANAAWSSSGCRAFTRTNRREAERFGCG